MRIALSCGLGLALLCAGSAAETLENRHVSVAIDPQRGGAVTAMMHRRAVRIPFLEDRGAGVAGKGRFFVPLLEVEGRRLDLGEMAMRVSPNASPREVSMTGDLKQLSPGLTITRRFELGDEESGLRITDRILNGGGGARGIMLRVGGASCYDGQPWTLSLRCWFGDARTWRWMFTPYGRGTLSQLEAASERPFWRVLGQYGTGFLYLPAAAGKPVQLTHRLPEKPGHPAEFEWLGAAMHLPAGGETVVASEVLIDTGGRDGGTPSAVLGSDRTIVHVDLPAAGRRGEPMDVFVTVTSAIARRVQVAVLERTVLRDWGKETDALPPRQAAGFDVDVPAGIGVVRHFRHRPSHAGVMYLRPEVRDVSGRQLSATEARAVIDGERISEEGELAQIWKRYTRRLPEVHLRGTWEDIGRQLAQLGLVKPGAERPHAADRLALYERRFPYYARLLRGAAAELKVPPIRLAALEGAEAAGPACMGVLVRGPDGPLHLYSKERGGSSLAGMGYVKVLPDAGYRYHMYTLNRATFGYGVNEAGLSTSGATINCDANTERVGNQETQRRLDRGQATAPMGMHMLLAMCADVDQAVRFVTDAEAPLEFTGNMLIADRQGHAAILESVGTYQQVIRCSREQPFCSTGNYPHRRADGLFAIGDNWGWAANTMLRERFLESLIGERGGQVSLADAFMLMATRAEPGGMCQLTFDNVGTLYSTCAAIAVTRSGDFYISHGPPNQVAYVRYRLDETQPGDTARQP